MKVKQLDSIRAANERLVDVYFREFLTQLISQSVDQKDRYKQVSHKSLSVGDIVLLVEPNTKRSNFPMAIVKQVNFNDIGEVTSTIVLKGRTRERVFRQASSLIPLLQLDSDEEQLEAPTSRSEPTVQIPPRW